MWRCCSGWCAGLRPSAQSFPRRRPRSNGSGSSYRSCSAASLVGAPNGSMKTSCSLALKISAPTSRESKLPCRLGPPSYPWRGRKPTGQACRRISPAKRCGSILGIAPAPAAVARCMRSARLSARCSTMFGRGFGSSAFADRYGCRSCGTIHQAPATERPIAKGLASPSLLAHVLVSKYCWNSFFVLTNKRETAREVPQSLSRRGSAGVNKDGCVALAPNIVHHAEATQAPNGLGPGVVFAARTFLIRRSIASAIHHSDHRLRMPSPAATVLPA
jgi:hypothetical protein